MGRRVLLTLIWIAVFGLLWWLGAALFGFLFAVGVHAASLAGKLFGFLMGVAWLTCLIPLIPYLLASLIAGSAAQSWDEPYSRTIGAWYSPLLVEDEIGESQDRLLLAFRRGGQFIYAYYVETVAGLLRRSTELERSEVMGKKETPDAEETRQTELVPRVRAELVDEDEETPLPVRAEGQSVLQSWVQGVSDRFKGEQEKLRYEKLKELAQARTGALDATRDMTVSEHELKTVEKDTELTDEERDRDTEKVRLEKDQLTQERELTGLKSHVEQERLRLELEQLRAEREKVQRKEIPTGTAQPWEQPLFELFGVGQARNLEEALSRLQEQGSDSQDREDLRELHRRERKKQAS